MDIGTTLILVAIFTLLEAFFSGSEIALISASRVKIQQKANEGSADAKALVELLKTPERVFAITSLGTNLAVVTSTSIFAAYMVARFEDKGDLYATLLLAPFILFLGEIVPKMVFQNRADSIILPIVPPLTFFFKIFSPIITFFTKTSNLLLKQVQDHEQIQQQTFSRDLIRKIISLDSKTADLGQVEREMIHKIFNFGETTVEQCMTPLVQLYCIPDTATLAEAHQIANTSGFSRLPVFHERMFNLIGVLNTFDLLGMACDDSPITHLIRPAYYVPPNKKIDDLLKEVQQRGLHMAIVVDEYGGCIGIVTIEDLLEEIVGEIEDEYDKPEKRHEAYADGGYLIDADMEIEVANETLNLDLPRGNYETLAGLVIDQLATIPAPGEQVEVGGYRLTVKETGKRKINSVILRKLNDKPEPSPDAAVKDPVSPSTPDKPSGFP